jgi:hypothetical protein
MRRVRNPESSLDNSQRFDFLVGQETAAKYIPVKDGQVFPIEFQYKAVIFFVTLLPDYPLLLF